MKIRQVVTLGLLAGGAPFSLLAQRKGRKERAAVPLRKPRSAGFATGWIVNSLALKHVTIPVPGSNPHRPAQRQWPLFSQDRLVLFEPFSTGRSFQTTQGFKK